MIDIKKVESWWAELPDTIDLETFVEKLYGLARPAHIDATQVEMELWFSTLWRVGNQKREAELSIPVLKEDVCQKASWYLGIGEGELCRIFEVPRTAFSAEESLELWESQASKLAAMRTFILDLRCAFRKRDEATSWLGEKYGGGEATPMDRLMEGDIQTVRKWLFQTQEEPDWPYWSSFSEIEEEGGEHPPELHEVFDLKEVKKADLKIPLYRLPEEVEEWELVIAFGEELNKGAWWKSASPGGSKTPQERCRTVARAVPALWWSFNATDEEVSELLQITKKTLAGWRQGVAVVDDADLVHIARAKGLVLEAQQAFVSPEKFEEWFRAGKPRAFGGEAPLEFVERTKSIVPVVDLVNGYNAFSDLD